MVGCAAGQAKGGSPDAGIAIDASPPGQGAVVPDGGTRLDDAAVPRGWNADSSTAPDAGGGNAPMIDAAGPPPPPLSYDCRDDALDLGIDTPAIGTTSIMLDAPSSSGFSIFTGIPTPVSPPIYFCLPPDAISVMVMSYPRGLITAFQSPDADLLDPSSMASLMGSPVGIDTLGFRQLLFPAAPQQEIYDGLWAFRSGWSDLSGQSPLYVTVRRGDPNAPTTIDINLITVVDSGLTPADLEAVQAAARGALAQLLPGSPPSNIGFGTITDPSLAVIDNTNDQSYHTQLAAADVADGHTLIDLAPTFYILRSMSSPAFSVLYGESSGVPGPALIGAGVAISTEGHRTADGRIDLPHLTTTMAHELGHFVGLRHSSERDGANHDHLADTPECWLDSHDADGSGIVDLGECPDDGNFMFWEGAPSDGRVTPTMTADQGWVVRRSPWARQVI